MAILRNLTVRARILTLPLPFLLLILLLFGLYRREVVSRLEFSDQELRGVSLIQEILKHKTALSWANDEYTDQDLKLILERSDFPVKQYNWEEMIRAVGDESNLILDPDLDTYYMMETAIITYPSRRTMLKTALDVMRGRKIEDKISLSTEERLQLLSLFSNLIYNSETINKAMNKVCNISPEYKSSLCDTILQKEGIFHTWAVQVRTDLSQGNDISYHFIITEGQFNESFDLLTIAYQNLKVGLETRVSKIKEEAIFYIVFVSLVLILSSVLVYFLIKSILSPLKSIESSLQKAIRDEGVDLTVEIQVEGKNEISHLASEFSALFKTFSQIALTMHRSAKELDLISEKSSESSRALSQSAVLFASNSEEASAAIEELFGSYRMVRESVGAVTEGVKSTARQMKIVGQVIEFVSISMEQNLEAAAEGVAQSEKSIKEARIMRSFQEEILKLSQEIFGIVIFIKEIAEQTNLLSLNASIEAARAGEHGRGFAVVAQEISKLSEKTNESVKRIQELIGKTRDSIRLSVDQVGKTENEIVILGQKVMEIQNKQNTLKGELAKQSDIITESAQNLQVLRGHAEGLDQAAGEQERATQEIKVTVDTVSLDAQFLAEQANDFEKMSDRSRMVSTQLTGLVSLFNMKGLE